MRVAVIGAGPSGLAAGKIFKQHGHDVEIFEQGDKCGGVWRVAFCLFWNAVVHYQTLLESYAIYRLNMLYYFVYGMRYPEARLQDKGAEYSFTDFPPKKELLVTHPNAEELLEYFQDYAKHFKIYERIHFNTEVIRVEKTKPTGWAIYTKDLLSKKENPPEAFDFVIIASGQFSNNPNIPEEVEKELASQNRTFRGEIIHDRSYTSLEKLKNKKVAVIGYGKTALDVVTQAADLAKSAHLIYREPRWIIPEWMFGMIYFGTIFFARHASYFMDSWSLAPWQAFVQRYLWFIPWMFWRTMEVVFCVSMRWGYGHPLIPTTPIEKSFRVAIALAPPNFGPRVREKKIQLHKANNVSKFASDGFYLINGDFVEADLLICATGYKFNLNILPEYKHLVANDGIQLYKHVLHPDIPDLAFAGFNHNFLHIPGVEIGMLWVLAVLQGDIKLPTREEQLKEIEHIRAWKEKNVLFENVRLNVVGTRFFSYFDELLTDLGVNPYRKSNPIAESLMPYASRDYATVIQESTQYFQRKRKSN